MSRIVYRFLIVLGVTGLLLPIRAGAEARLEKKPAPYRVDVISDGLQPWTMSFANYANQGSPRLIPGGTDRVFYVNGSAMHLIDSKSGVVLRRWVFSNRIDAVQLAGANFTVHTSRQEADNPVLETVTIGLDLPSPDYWLDSLLMYRLASFEGNWLDSAVHFQTDSRSDRIPLSHMDAGRRLVDVKEAVRRNPFLARLGVVEALLLKDAGRKDADAVFREALARTDFYGELFWIAQDLENNGEAEWAGLAFDQALASFWKHGSDPRLVSMLLPKLIMGYLPFDARVETISATRRGELSERLYRMAPNVEGSGAAWSALANYFSERGDSQRAAVWRARAKESAARSGYVGELDSAANRAILAVAALFVAILLCQLVLQRRYAFQRRLNRQAGFFAWLRRGDPRSWYVYWDRRDRWMLALLLLSLWLVTGLSGAMVETSNRLYSWPITGTAGSLRAPAVRAYLESLGATPERDFLLALSLQQAGESSRAESLYRRLPASAEAWNNLGVIQAGQHKDNLSVHSFRKALSIDPGIAESALNLGQTTTDYWAVVHEEYLPGQKMLAMPHRQMVYAAVRGPWLRILSRIAMGPFSAMPAIGETISRHYADYQIASPLPFRLLNESQYAVILGLSFAFAAILMLLLFAPYREVTQAPGRWHWLLELLIPGTSRRWRLCGALVLALFVYGMYGMLDAEIWPPAWPSIVSFATYRGLGLGLPASLEHAFLAASLADAGTIWMRVPPILASLLFVVNAVMVIHGMRRRAH